MKQPVHTASTRNEQLVAGPRIVQRMVLETTGGRVPKRLVGDHVNANRDAEWISDKYVTGRYAT
jgi:hypothetical protein